MTPTVDRPSAAKMLGTSVASVSKAAEVGLIRDLRVRKEGAKKHKGVYSIKDIKDLKRGFTWHRVRGWQPKPTPSPVVTRPSKVAERPATAPTAAATMKAEKLDVLRQVIEEARPVAPASGLHSRLDAIEQLLQDILKRLS